MNTPMTPEHLQLFSRHRLAAAAAPTERVSATDETATTDDLTRMARYEQRRRQGLVPVRHRYASAALRTSAV